MTAAHGPFLASDLARFAAATPGTHLVHGFGGWGYGGVLACRRLARRGIEAISVLSSYTTARVETRSKAEGLASWYGFGARLTYRAEHLWTSVLVEPFERRMYSESRAVLYNYDSVWRLLSQFGPNVKGRKVSYAPESAFLRTDGEPRGPVPAPAAALNPPGAPLIVCVSRHDPRKGVDVLLEALAKVKASGVPFRACLLAPGPLLEANRERAARLGLNGSAVLTGFVPDPWEYLRHADVFVLPSRAEQSGSMALLEAMQAGVAPVVSACDGIPEDVTDGVDALLVPPADPEALAAALGRVLSDASLRRRLAQGARRTFEARFSADAFTKSLGDAYADLGFRP